MASPQFSGNLIIFIEIVGAIEFSLNLVFVFIYIVGAIAKFKSLAPRAPLLTVKTSLASGLNCGELEFSISGLTDPHSIWGTLSAARKLRDPGYKSLGSGRFSEHPAPDICNPALRLTSVVGAISMGDSTLCLPVAKYYDKLPTTPKISVENISPESLSILSSLVSGHF